MKTYVTKEQEVDKRWFLVDAEDKTLGRLATQIAVRLRGKHKPIFSPYLDAGDFVVVVNAEKVALTGRKWQKKVYYRHSGYTGGLKSITARQLLEKRPEDLIRFAVKGMLPKNRIGRKLFKKLKVYAGGEHPHSAQQPETLKL